jgi:hypothetical protein
MHERSLDDGQMIFSSFFLPPLQYQFALYAADTKYEINPHNDHEYMGLGGK